MLFSRRSLFLAAGLAISLCLTAGIPPHVLGSTIVSAEAPSRKLDPRIRIMLLRLGEGRSPNSEVRAGSSLREPRPAVAARQKADGRYWVSALVRVQDDSAVSDLRRLGCRVTSFRDGIACVDLPLDQAEAVASLPSVLYLEAAKRARPRLDVSVPEIGADRASEEYGATGRGVIVGIVDTGIDVLHPDFIRPDGTSRVLYLWDQNAVSGTSPAGFGYGREYTATDIAVALRTPSLRPRDAGSESPGHGTHVCGIAAGNGRASGRYVGVAPEADLIVVATDFEHSLDANRYILAKAEELKRPVVINLSWGSHYGPHDGTDLETSGLNALVGPGKPGRAITVAAGNEGEDEIHVSGAVSLDKSAEFSAYTPLGTSLVEIDIWHDSRDTFLTSVGYRQSSGAVASVLSATTGTVRRKSITSGVFAGAVVTIDCAEAPYINNTTLSHVMVDVDLSQTDYGGRPNAPWVITLQKVAGTGSGEFHAWLSSEDGQYFTARMGEVPGNSELTITDQACAPNLISVGSYVTRTRWTNIDGHLVDYGVPGYPPGSMSYFTSRGPTRDGRLKPDLVAPGEWIASAMSGDALVTRSERATVTEDGMHWYMQGTSMSSPHVAGVIALMFQLNPNLDASEIRSILRDTAR
ncbi:MAG: S8 family peptidase, partial [Armatimonadota bacterium]